ncbi:OmpH family outer membrane protein [Jannaschia seohaensis]|uniref:Outer membrane OmpH-like protein n=1 Tax=Jannaschia seohaensis TaxID=475081 RepID=A0A2Y9AU00_9RHOB|nr:OmpH family outer membrane protein [Jannaschia seohaensis]PWJ19315.1 outer membrane OmpH-like protein [Jannaschia seohaensis]SSA45977.1 Outer membrane protein (OmpH-like) [Jannaschia seohaensis]
MWRALALFLALCGAPAGAQGLPSGVPASAVVVLDRDLLFTQTRFGRRILSDIEASSRELAAENRRIEAELEAEERALTERRAELPPEEFQSLADAFDEKVTGIRQTQDAKARNIQLRSDRAQAIFFEQANPILLDLVREIGALVILDRRIVIASADRVDITTLARDRIDAALGEGEGLPDAVSPSGTD